MYEKKNPSVERMDGEQLDGAAQSVLIECFHSHRQKSIVTRAVDGKININICSNRTNQNIQTTTTPVSVS